MSDFGISAADINGMLNQNVHVLTYRSLLSYNNMTRLELVSILYISRRTLCNTLTIYQMGPGGKVRTQ